MGYPGATVRSSTSLALRSLLLPLLLCVAACDCGSDPGGSCTTAADCASNEACVDGMCVPRTSSDGGVDASESDDGGTDAGPECVRNEDCDGDAACVDGMCCAADQVCAGACCGADAVCFASACVVPRGECVTASDCEDGQYCEPGLGEDGGSPDAGVDAGMPDAGACHASPPRGRCVDLPPDCGPGVPEPCITSCEFRPEVEDLDAVTQWYWGQGTTETRPDFVDVWATPTVGRVADANCDGVVDDLDPPNVVFVAGNARTTCCSCGGFSPSTCLTGVLRVLHGGTGEELWALEEVDATSIGFAGLSVALGDVDGDDELEIAAVTGEGRVAIIDGDGTPLAVASEVIPQRSAGNFGWGGGLSLGDMEGDGDVEIAYASSVWTYAGGALTLKFTGASGTGGYNGGTSLSFFADVTGDENLELVAGRTVYDATGAVIWNAATPQDGFTALGDFDVDGSPEVVLVANGSVFLLDGDTGADELPAFALPGTGRGGPPTVADMDGDGLPEIGVAQQNFYTMIEVNYGAGAMEAGWSTQNHDLSSSVTGSTVFDFEGDGIAEVVYNDECWVWVYDGPTGRVRYSFPTASFTATEASLVADVDGDGHAEILVIANGANPSTWSCAEHRTDDVSDDGLPAWVAPEYGPSHRGITLLRDRANSWVGTRRIWNQHAYHVTNVCSDRDSACDPARPYGAIPERAQANHELPWLNNFRQNVGEAGIFDAPDAVLTLEVECAPAAVVANVRNVGAAILPAGVVVEIVHRSGGDAVLGTLTTTSSLFPGQVQQLRLPIDVDPMDTFGGRIVIDPDARTFRECDETNNDAEDVTTTCLL